MHSSKLSSGYPGWQRTIPRIAGLIGLVCFSLLSLFLSTGTGYAAGVPGGNVTDPVVRQIDIARPAVVRIITSLGGSLGVRFSATTASVGFPQGGGTYTIRLSGSGAFISAHGDILTADHVVNPPHDQQLDDALFQEAATDVANYINAHFQVTQPFTPEGALADLEAGIFPTTTNYGAASSEVYLSTAYAGQLSGTKIEGLPSSVRVPVDRIEQQSSFNAKDVAIIHVKGMDNMPSIQLGDSDGVQEQDTLTIIGFPGNGDISNSPIDFLTSSINKIYVSALKTTDAGAPVIQVGGNVEHGDSGGPALDANGNIVGIVSFGSVGQGSTSFLQASNSAQDLIQQLGLDTRPGSLQTAWNQALKDYASLSPGHWHKAQQELQALSTRYQQFAGINPYLSYAQTQATHEQVPQGQTQPGYTSMLLPIGVAGLVLLIVVMILFVMIMLRRGRRRQVSLAGVPGSVDAPVLYASSAFPATPPLATPLPTQSGSEQYAAAVAPLYASQPYVSNTPGVAIAGETLASVEQGTRSPLWSQGAQNEIDAHGRSPVNRRPYQKLEEQGTRSPLWSQGTPGRFDAPANSPTSGSLYREREEQGEQHGRSPIWSQGARSSFDTHVSPLASEEQEPYPYREMGQLRNSPAGPGASGKLPAAYMPSAFETLIRKPVERAADTPSSPFAGFTPSPSQAEEQPGEDKTAISPMPPSSGAFAVPRRPGPPQAGAETYRSNTYGQSLWVAPCGHLNTREVRFCRICGKEVATNENPAG